MGDNSWEILRKRRYILKTPTGGTSRAFGNLVEAYRFLKQDSPDLTPRTLLGLWLKPLIFADGYRLVRVK